MLPSLSTYKPFYINMLVYMPWPGTHVHVDFLGHLVCVFSSLFDIATLFSRMVVLVYTPSIRMGPLAWIQVPSHREWGGGIKSWKE